MNLTSQKDLQSQQIYTIVIISNCMWSDGWVSIIALIPILVWCALCTGNIYSTERSWFQNIALQKLNAFSQCPPYGLYIATWSSLSTQITSNYMISWISDNLGLVINSFALYDSTSTYQNNKKRHNMLKYIMYVDICIY